MLDILPLSPDLTLDLRHHRDLPTHCILKTQNGKDTALRVDGLDTLSLPRGWT